MISNAEEIERAMNEGLTVQMTQFAPPDSPVAIAASRLAGDYHSTAMFNHVMRSWYWARGFAALESRTDFNEELLFVAAVLHDMGTTEAFDSHTLSYEEAGGHVALALTAGAGWPRTRQQRVLEVIVRHNWSSVDPGLDVEGYLLESATGLDITGARSDALPEDFAAEVLAAYPRLDVAREFTACVTDQAERKPSTAAHRIVRNGLAEKMRDHPFERPGPTTSH